MAPGESLDCDICIIGSGPAGATLQRELAGGSLRVVVVESGGRTPQVDADALSAIENVGAPRVMNQSDMRPRRLGGTSMVWTGRCAPFDDIDYARRPWVPHSGWPIGPVELQPYLDRSAEHLGLGVGTGYTEAGPPRRFKRRPTSKGVDGQLLRPFFWQFSTDSARRYDSMRFGRRMLRETADNVRVLTNASVTHIDAGATASSAPAVEVTGRDGARRTIAASTIVLCAGGIENARILLASNRIAASGLGNGRDLVGRFLMDHPRGGVAAFDHTRARELRSLFGMQFMRTGQGSFLFCQGFRLSPEAQEREGLLNCAVWLSEQVRHDDPWSALQRILRRKATRPRRDAMAIASNLPLVFQGMHQGLRGGVIPRRLEGLELNCTVEQRPDPDSRVMLSDRVDRHGTPLSRIDWRVNGQEQQTVRRTAQLVARECARLGAPTPVLDKWVRDEAPFPPSFQDVAHHMGTTRMSVAPSGGVVDPDCQIHGIRGLYVSGSSVFPTVGHANPTQMIVALAVRLADTLKQRAALERAA